MADYKRKKVNKSPFKKKPSAKNFIEVNEEVKVKHKRKPKSTKTKTSTSIKDTEIKTARNKRKENLFSDFKLIKTDKINKKSKTFKIIASILVIALLVFILNLISPTGIIEGTSNFFNSLGSGNYPVQYNGSLTFDCIEDGSCYYILNDTSISLYNSNGKEIFKDIHGFSGPVMCVSSSRAIVFDQNGTELKIYNYSGLLRTVTTKEKIINASICRNGYFAVSTSGGEYTSSVTVYNKSFKKLYTWNSAKEIINFVCLSSNGKKLALSALDINGGKPVSNIYVLEYSSATPVFSTEFNDDIILNLRGTSNGFAAVTSTSYSFFKWRNYDKTEYKVTDKNISLCRINGNDTLLVFNRESDKTNNRVIYLNSSGISKGEFDYKGIITDVQIKSGRIFFISDTKISATDKNGETKATGTCDYGIKRFAVISSDKIAAITDDLISEIELD